MVSRRVSRSAALGFVVLACPWFLSACAESGTAAPRGKEAAAKSVKTEAVREEAVHRTVEVVGTLAAEDNVTLSSQAEGVVRRVLADLGDAVKADQPLVELDHEKPQYNLDQQKASLARSLTKYGGTDINHLPPAEETPDVRKAAAELAQAKQANERAEELHKRTLIPQQSLDDAKAAYQSKLASYDSALQTAKNLRADIDVADAALKLADRQLRDAFIRAPFDGFVQKRMVSIGELVKSDMPVMTVVRVDPLKVLAEIPERMAPWIKVGQAVTLKVDAFPDQHVQRHDLAHQPRRQHPDAHLLVRSAGAQSRRDLEARHVRARPARNRAGRAGHDDPLYRDAVPLRHQPRVRREGQRADRA